MGAAADLDANGGIDYAEFVAWVFDTLPPTEDTGLLAELSALGSAAGETRQQEENIESKPEKIWLRVVLAKGDFLCMVEAHATDTVEDLKATILQKQGNPDHI